MDVKRAADLYAQGRTLRQIGAELGLSSTTVSHQLRRAGVTMRRGARARPASTLQIVELRDQGRTRTAAADATTSVAGPIQSIAILTTIEGLRATYGT